jgi:hypothetical protein
VLLLCCLLLFTLLQTDLSGAGDCAKTDAWGTNWNWNRDWSQDWGKDFDLEWKENKEAAEAMKPYVDSIEAAVRQAVVEATVNCSVAVGLANATQAIPGSGAKSNVTGDTSSSSSEQQQDLGVAEGISDGSAGTVDGVAMRAASYNCTAAAIEAAAAEAAANISNSSSSRSASTPLRRLTAAPAALLLESPASMNSVMQHPQVAAALAAAAAATNASVAGQTVVWKGMAAAVQLNLQGKQQQGLQPQLSFQNYGGVEGWAVGCWYCVGSYGESSD